MSPSLTQLTELSQLNTSSGFHQKRKFLERWGTKVSSRDVSRNFFRPGWASPPVQLSLLVGWAFYIKSELLLIIIEFTIP